MTKLTINQLLQLNSELRGRLQKLEMIQSSSTNSEVTYFGEDLNKKTEKTPQYDPETLDVKIVELRNFLFKSEAAIKQANAVTTVDLDVDQDSLLAAIPKKK
jgi:hypothetical protein